MLIKIFFLLTLSIYLYSQESQDNYALFERLDFVEMKKFSKSDHISKYPDSSSVINYNSQLIFISASMQEKEILNNIIKNTIVDRDSFMLLYQLSMNYLYYYVFYEESHNGTIGYASAVSSTIEKKECYLNILKALVQNKISLSKQVVQNNITEDEKLLLNKDSKWKVFKKSSIELFYSINKTISKEQWNYIFNKARLQQLKSIVNEIQTPLFIKSSLNYKKGYKKIVLKQIKASIKDAEIFLEKND